MSYDWDFSVLRGTWPLFRDGIAVTLVLTVAVVVAGTIAGVGYAIIHRLAPRALKPIILLLMDVMRSLPLYVLILLSAYALPQTIPSLRGAPALVLAWIGLSMYLGALCADVVRGALNNVPVGAIDAGLAVGLSRRRVLLHIELPIALRSTIPTQALLWIGMLKNSSLAAVIGVYELAHVSDNIGASTSRGPEAYVIVAAVFVVMVLPFSWLARLLENRMAPARRVAE